MKKIAKLINFTEEIVSAVEEYQKENSIATFTGAVVELIRKGLER